MDTNLRPRHLTKDMKDLLLGFSERLVTTSRPAIGLMFKQNHIHEGRKIGKIVAEFRDCLSLKIQ
ncbi:hypothetical protein CFP56_024593 [Quercus suber]|uniref:Uncharacterized protein n=1 Tax=Quercus suber TaxID=58331 RepID=A0AAW0K6G5_QUESU